MKLIQSTRVLLIADNAAERSEIASGLTELGIGAVTTLRMGECCKVFQEGPGADVCVVRVDTQAPALGTQPVLCANCANVDVPRILLLDDPARAHVGLPAEIGFDAVVATPVQPRVLYRRIGAVMQRARRVGRQGDRSVGMDAAAGTASMAGDPDRLRH